MGAARQLDERDDARCRISGPALRRIGPGPGPGNGHRAGRVAGRKAAMGAVVMAARPDGVAALINQQGRPRPIDRPLDECLDAGRERMGREHSRTGAGEPRIAGRQAADQRRQAPGDHRRLVAQLAHGAQHGDRRRFAQRGCVPAELDIGLFNRLQRLVLLFLCFSHGRNNADRGRRSHDASPLDFPRRQP